MGYLTPPVDAPQRPGKPQDQADENLKARILYLRSFLLMRTLIGVMGILLPVTLLLGDGFLFEGGKPRGSLSAYYYSGMRDIFVSCLCVTAFFLIFYKFFERNLENTLSIVAGVTAVGVALFPTGRPGGGTVPLSPLQEKLGEQTVQSVHYVCAATFILCLGVISYFFGRREGARSQHRDGHLARFSPAFWRSFHYACAAGIALAVVYIAVTQVFHTLDAYSLIIGETASVLCFGASWLAKGLELDVLTSASAAQDQIEAGTTEETAAA
ncbi:DUF998 domain-containing protein [Dactylosporangium maewongense]|uniref:DUF998 domain-containing protein n=1 Tax=Dactylosporangium maewongense TaxID=634393 RepID=A0ABP4NSV6_9ACTN